MDIRNFFKKSKPNCDSTCATEKQNLSANDESTNCKTGREESQKLELAAEVLPSTSSDSKNEGANFYHGRKLDLNWLLTSYPFFKKSVQADGKRNRNFVSCEICAKFKDEAAKVSRNGVVAFAEGIRVDSSQGLERMIDHLDSKPHLAASEAKKAAELWEQQSDKHPWINTLKKHREGVVNDLIALCMDVYNDSLLETPTARSWPARSLAVMRAKSIQAQLYDSKDWGIQLDEFQPPASALHYRDPVIYAEMLDIIGDLEMQKLGDEFKSAICVSLQIDGSVDRGNKDMKFVIAKYVSENEPTVLQNRFVGVIQPESTGAQGLLEATLQVCKNANIPTNLLVGITTDGEAANTGREAGLWKLLEDHLQRKLLTIWCFCHRSDLAMESALSTVPELKHWLTNTTAVSTYFRTAPAKLKRMTQLFPQYHSFPAYFEVRFAEHVHNLIDTVLHNLPGCISYWQELSNDLTNKSFLSRTDKAKANGMLKMWNVCDSLQIRQTYLMADITLILQDLQKKLQKGNLILPDVITLKNNALRKLKIMQSGPYPGGKEEQLVNPGANNEVESNTEEENESSVDENESSGDENESSVDENESSSEENGSSSGEHSQTEEIPRKRRKVTNSYVTTGTRDWAAIRNEIVLSFINFLDERLNIEENGIIKKFSSFLNSKTAREMIDNGRLIISEIFGEAEVLEFTNNVCDCWPRIVEIGDLDSPDDGVKMSYKLRKMVPATTGLLKKLLCSFLIISPHSMTVEKSISHYNQFKSIHRTSTLETTLNSRMAVTLNGVGTAHYDPRPAVAAFLKKKERRYREPDPSTYADRDFVQKFFRKNGGL